MLIPTFSPQGDGNVQYEPGIRSLITRSLIPTFSPQGDGNTAKLLLRNSLCSSRLLIPTFSPQGDGNPVSDQAQ